MYDSNHTATSPVAGREIPLEADFTAALAETLARDESLERAGLGGLFDAHRWSDRAGLSLLEPFDPQRIPVLFVHGLLSSPMTWREMVNDLWSDPAIRARYQFWFFLYPTGNPFAYSANLLRRAIAEVRETNDPERRAAAIDDMVVIGHSMGGLLARRLATDPGDSLWRAVSEVEFDDLVVDESDRETLREIFLSPRVPEVRRVVFIAVPHRGSTLADVTPSRIVSRLVRLPPDLIDAAGRVFEANPDQVRLSAGRGWPVATGIDTLSPNSPLLAALAELPAAPGVEAHSIIGRRRGGDAPGGSDGTVTYESAHVPWVASEFIVADSDHGVPRRPAAIREVRRIPLLHAAEVDSRERDHGGAAPSAR